MLQAERRALPAETSRARIEPNAKARASAMPSAPPGSDDTRGRDRSVCRTRSERRVVCGHTGQLPHGCTRSLTADDTDDDKGEELEPLPAVVVRHLCGEPRLRPIDLSRTDPTDPKAEANPHHNSARMHACTYNASVCVRARVKPACVKLRVCTRAFIAHTVRGGRRQWGLGPCVRPQQRLARSRML